MPLPIPKRLRKTPSHARAPKHEQAIADTYGGRLVRGSGCGAEKGDVRIERVARIEAKTTSSGSYRLTPQVIAKIERAAMSSASGEVPILEVEFTTKQGKPVANVAVIPVWALTKLIDQCQR